MSGLDFQQQLKKADHQISIIFMTGQSDIPLTVKAMKVGALEFLSAPFEARHLMARSSSTQSSRPWSATPSVASKVRDFSSMCAIRQVDTGRT